MSVMWWGIVFGGSCVAAAVVISVACLRIFALENAREDAHYARLRSAGMGDPLSVPAPDWCNAPHDRLPSR